MSLYNMLHGMNPVAPILKAVLGLDQERDDTPKWPKNDKGDDWYPYDDGSIPAGEKYIEERIAKADWPTGRFRDIYLNEDATLITLYTRNGGGNRDEYFWVFDILRKHPQYVRNWDDDFDCTYAYIEFKVPPEAQELCKKLMTGDKPKTIHEKFQETMAAMQKMTPAEIRKDKRFAPIVDALGKIAKPKTRRSAGGGQ
jgi:hypothetical protein